MSEKEKLHKCHLCSRVCLNRIGLLNHIRYIHTEKNKLEKVNRFQNRSKLKSLVSRKCSLPKQVETVHVKQEEFQCQICAKSFTRSQYLIVHMKAIHEKRQNTCKMCKKTFGYKGHLLNHMKQAHGKKKCQIF